jgi:predicted Zn-ribbon and HTH transcriptional regulator
MKPSGEKPSRNEEEYFAKREADLIKSRREASERASQEAMRQSHYMKCPKCGADLVTEDHDGVQVDRCPECHGMWLDAGETAGLVKRESGGIVGVLKSVVRGVAST